MDVTGENNNNNTNCETSINNKLMLPQIATFFDKDDGSSIGSASSIMSQCCGGGDDNITSSCFVTGDGGTDLRRYLDSPTETCKMLERSEREQTERTKEQNCFHNNTVNNIQSSQAETVLVGVASNSKKSDPCVTKTKPMKVAKKKCVASNFLKVPMESTSENLVDVESFDDVMNDNYNFYHQERRVSRISQISHIKELKEGVPGLEHLDSDYYELSRVDNPDDISLDSIHKKVFARCGANKFDYEKRSGHKCFVVIATSLTLVGIISGFYYRNFM